MYLDNCIFCDITVLVNISRQNLDSILNNSTFYTICITKYEHLYLRRHYFYRLEMVTHIKSVYSEESNLYPHFLLQEQRIILKICPSNDSLKHDQAILYKTRGNYPLKRHFLGILKYLGREIKQYP